MNKPNQITNAVLAAREFERCARLLRSYAEDVDAVLYLRETRESMGAGMKLVSKLATATGARRKKRSARSKRKTVPRIRLT